MRAVVFSLAVCAVASMSVAIVIADAVSAPTRAPTPHVDGGWTTTVFKNPH